MWKRWLMVGRKREVVEVHVLLYDGTWFCCSLRVCVRIHIDITYALICFLTRTWTDGSVYRGSSLPSRVLFR